MYTHTFSHLEVNSSEEYSYLLSLLKYLVELGIMKLLFVMFIFSIISISIFINFNIFIHGEIFILSLFG